MTSKKIILEYIYLREYVDEENTGTYYIWCFFFPYQSHQNNLFL